MQTFSNLAELQQLVDTQLKHLPFDDDRAAFDTFYENTLEIKFNNTEGATTIDDDGEEKEIFDRLLIKNVESFNIEVEDNGAPHQLRAIEKVGDNAYLFDLSHARWVVHMSQEPQGEFGEMIDDVEFELEFNMETVLKLLGALAIGGAVVWVVRFFVWGL
ncbi:MAG: hypothetical protein AAGD96_28905 [Chloroflexota bacterium]